MENAIVAVHEISRLNLPQIVIENSDNFDGSN